MKKAAVKDFAYSQGSLCCSLFLRKFQAFRTATLLKQFYSKETPT